MTTLQERFVDEFLKDFNGAAACRRAGYSVPTARQEAYKLMKDSEVKAAIKERLDLLSMSSEEAIKRLTDWGRGSFTPFTVEHEEHGLVLDLKKSSAKKHLHLIRKIKQTKKTFYSLEGDVSSVDFTTEIELHDAKDAVDKIAKIRGLYVDKVVHSADDTLEGFSITVNSKKSEPK
jgi:phage terminase small subunit